VGALILGLIPRFDLSAPTAGEQNSHWSALFRLDLLANFTGLKTAFLVPMRLLKLAGTLAR